MRTSSSKLQSTIYIAFNNSELVTVWEPPQISVLKGGFGHEEFEWKFRGAYFGLKLVQML
jgi:hypothetical protein